MKQPCLALGICFLLAPTSLGCNFSDDGLVTLPPAGSQFPPAEGVGGQRAPGGNAGGGAGAGAGAGAGQMVPSAAPESRPPSTLDAAAVEAGRAEMDSGPSQRDVAASPQVE